MDAKRKDKDEGRNPLLYLFEKTLEYSGNNRKVLVAAWVMFVVAEIITVLCTPFVWAKMMNIVQQSGITTATIGPLLWLLLLTIVVEMVFWALHGPARVMECGNSFIVEANYRKYLLRGVMTLPLDWHTDHHSGDTIDKIEKGRGALDNFAEESFEVIYGIVRLLVSFTTLAYFSHPSALVVLVMICISAFITIQFDKVMIPQYKELNHAGNQISESMFDAISNITTVIILRVEKLVYGAIVEKIDKPYGLYVRNCKLNEMKWFLTNMCCSVTTILVLGIYFWQNIGGVQTILVGNVYLLIQYLEKISRTFFQFTNMYGSVVRKRAKVSNSEELACDFRPENFTNHVLPADWQQLSIDELNFLYGGDDGANRGLHDVALSFIRGERVAFVGESGGGKTTVLKVMRDLYHPQSLRLSVDGRYLPEGFGGISRALALVPQDPEIFATTILENITLGAKYDMDFVRRFTDMACFTDVAEGLPKKFDSSIKEKGVDLSGGQKQRLALARGLLACHDKDVVLIDEPTSSIDSLTDMHIHRNIFREFGDKTIIESVHRLHLLPLFHRICMFAGGKVIAQGTLDELLVSCPEFQELWRQYGEKEKTESPAVCP